MEANTDVSSKGYYVREGKTGKGIPYKSINLQIVQEKNNRSFVELFGKAGDIDTLDTDNKKIKINYDDRFDEDVVKSVANFRKINVKIGEENKSYIASLDAINYIIDNFDDIKGKTVMVTGQRKKNVYNGKIGDRFEFSALKEVSDEDVVKRLTVNTILYFTKDSFDTADWKDEHKLYIHGWTEEYMQDVKENRYVPQTVVFDCGKVDWNNEKHVKQVSFRLKMIGCELDEDNKIVVKAKSKKVYKIGVITTFINGTEKVEFDESMLTPLQKEALELGLKTLDDFKPAGSVYGERVVIYKLKDFDLRKDAGFEDGYVEEDIKLSDFEDKVYIIQELTEDDIVSDDEDDNEDSDDEDSDDDNLFD